MSSAPGGEETYLPQRTHPLGFVVQGVAALRNLIFPAVALYFGTNSLDLGPLTLLGGLLAMAGFGLLVAFIKWRHLTYLTGVEDIRVESGLLSRTARSIPYERIQDISVEQRLLPRLFGLVELRFETGAGGKDEMTLRYVGRAEGERLRELVRERREDATNAAAIPVPVPGAGDDAAVDADIEAAPQLLFAMGWQRLVTFGLFRFSLAAVAVVGGAAQQFDFLLPFDIWDWKHWAAMASGPTEWLLGLGVAAQAVGIAFASLALLLVGFATGVGRTILRDWGFVLERTAKGFRRRRGLLTRTDVVMPAHRVQALVMGTGWLRKRFGWHALSFVSLAQDSGSSNHEVAPFAREGEIAAIAGAAGFAIVPGDPAAWQRADPRYRLDRALGTLLFFSLFAGLLALVLAIGGEVTPLVALTPFVVGVCAALRQLFHWRHDFNALDQSHVFARRGWLAPRREIASRVKLQSVEIAQGPVARRRGYATLHLGLAGGRMAIAGLPIARARLLREGILASIAATDFSELT